MNDVQTMLMNFEGAGPQRDGRHFPYTDSVGHLSIGYGHNLDCGIPHDLAIMLFNSDIADAIDAVRGNFSCYDALSRPRQLVLISMGFQFGKVGLGLWPRFISAVHRGDYDEAATQLLDSKVAREQSPVRFKQLAAMMKDNTSQWV